MKEKIEYSPYIEEIGKRLFRVIIVFLGAGVLGLIFSNKIILFLLKVFNFSGVNIVMTSPSQLVDLSVHTGLICGFMASLPLLINQLFDFVKPAFDKKEIDTIKKIFPMGVVLFFIGVTFGTWVTQFVITMYAEFSKGFMINNIWDIQTFFFQVIVTAILMGAVFELPIIISILIRLDLVKRQFFIKKRKYIYAASIIFAVLLPPTDIMSLVLLTLPLWFLFEITLLLNRDY